MLCRSCRRPVRTVWVQGGQRLLVDHKPDPAGNVVLKPGGPGRGAILSEAELVALPARARRFRCHAGTCPARAPWGEGAGRG